LFRSKNFYSRLREELVGPLNKIEVLPKTSVNNAAKFMTLNHTEMHYTPLRLKNSAGRKAKVGSKQPRGFVSSS